MKKRIKILIIGGTGFIGYHLIKRCLKKSFLVTSVSSKPPVKSRKLSKVKYLICDIRNEKKLIKVKLYGAKPNIVTIPSINGPKNMIKNLLLSKVFNLIFCY